MKIKTPIEQMRDRIDNLNHSINFIDSVIKKCEKFLRYKKTIFKFFIFQSESELNESMIEFKSIKQHLEDKKESIKNDIDNF